MAFKLAAVVHWEDWKLLLESHMRCDSIRMERYMKGKTI